MKEKFKVLSLSAGKFTDDQSREERTFASLNFLDKSVAEILEEDRINVGQQHAKMKICTDNNNELARKLANSKLIPGDIELELEMTTVKNAPALMVVGFTSLEQKINQPLAKN